MSIRMLYGETKIIIPIDITAYLESVEILAADITDAVFLLKADKTLADDATGTYRVTLGSDLTQTGPLFYARISSFSGLLAETKYHIGFGIKITGDTLFREVSLAPETNTLYFTQDISRG